MSEVNNLACRTFRDGKDGPEMDDLEQPQQDLNDSRHEHGGRLVPRRGSRTSTSGAPEG